MSTICEDTVWVVIRDLNACVVAAVPCDSREGAEMLKGVICLAHGCWAEVTDLVPFFVASTIHTETVEELLEKIRDLKEQLEDAR